MVKWPSTQLKYYELPLQQWIYLSGWWGTVWLIDHSWGYLSSLRVDIVSSWGLVFMNYTHGESADVYFFSLAAAKYPLCMIDRQYMSHFSPLHCSLLVIQTHLSVMVVKWWRVIRQKWIMHQNMSGYHSVDCCQNEPKYCCWREKMFSAALSLCPKANIHIFSLPYTVRI